LRENFFALQDHILSIQPARAKLFSEDWLILSENIIDSIHSFDVRCWTFDVRCSFVSFSDQTGLFTASGWAET
jgi:hypothetical protein